MFIGLCLKHQLGSNYSYPPTGTLFSGMSFMSVQELFQCCILCSVIWFNRSSYCMSLYLPVTDAKFWSCFRSLNLSLLYWGVGVSLVFINVSEGLWLIVIPLLGCDNCSVWYENSVHKPPEQPNTRNKHGLLKTINILLGKQHIKMTRDTVDEGEKKEETQPHIR